MYARDMGERGQGWKKLGKKAIKYLSDLLIQHGRDEAKAEVRADAAKVIAEAKAKAEEAHARPQGSHNGVYFRSSAILALNPLKSARF
jgi:hypothetical protein